MQAAVIMRTREHGVSLIELVVVVAIALLVAAVAVPTIISTRRNYRGMADARDIAALILLAKMRAASDFTRTRAYFDTSANTFHLEIWNKTTNGWIVDNPNGTQYLSQGIRFGYGVQTNPPPNTQAAIAQPQACMTGAAGPPPSPGGGSSISNAACIVFNSRGIPVDNNGAASGDNAIYITDGSGLYASTVSATGLMLQWRIDALDLTAAHWQKR
jgi:type IV fimbrial biogenesis protein FimT